MSNPNTPNYPTTLSTDDTLGVAAPGAQSSLTAGINSSVTTLPLANASVFALPTFVQIDSEIMATGTVASGNNINVDRGQCGTTAAAHSVNALVSAYFLPYMYNQLAAEIKSIESTLGENLSNVVLPSQSLLQTISIPVATAYTGIEGLSAVSNLNLSGSDTAAIPVVYDDTAGNGSLYGVLEFSDGAWAQGHFTLPGDWATGTNILCTFVWRSPSTVGTVQWSAQLGYLAPSSGANLTFASAVTSTGNVPSPTSLVSVFTTVTLPPPSGLAAGNELFFKIARGTDTAIANAELVSLNFAYTREPF